MNDRERVSAFCDYLENHRDPAAYHEIIQWARDSVNYYRGIFRSASIHLTDQIIESVLSLAREALWSELCVKKTFQWKSTLRTFVWQVTRFKVIDVKRDQANLLEHWDDLNVRSDSDEDNDTTPGIENLPDSSMLDPGEMADLSEKVQMIKEAINSLPEEDKMLMKMVCFEDMGPTEISKATGKSIGSMKTRICRNREKIAEYIKNRYGETF